MIKKFLFVAAIISLLIFSAPVIQAAMNSSNYKIWADTFSGGGGENLSAGDYRLEEIITDSVIGNVSSTNYNLKTGFREQKYYEGQEVLTLSIGSSSIDLGQLSTVATRSVTHTLTVNSNSYYGVSVTFSGSTLTCSSCGGTNTVSAIGGSSSAAVVGTSQFGFNATRTAGATPRAEAKAPYNTSGQYAFQSGDEIIDSTGDINATTFDITYIANISGSETNGTYSTTITYTATANF